MRVSRCITIAAIAELMTVIGPTGWAVPTPSIVPRSWELDFRFLDPQRITLTLPGDSKPTTYWYLLYIAVNNTGQDIKFYPTFDLVTNTLQVVRGGDEISPLVVDAIRARHKKQYPFFVDPMKASGLLLQGVDNARVSAAVFRNFDPQANRFTIYVGGLSGELQRLPNPAFEPNKPESDSNLRFFVLRKALGITYDLPGDVHSRKQAAPTRVKREWVMR